MTARPARAVNGGIGADAQLPESVTQRTRTGADAVDLPLLEDYEITEGETWTAR